MTEASQALNFWLAARDYEFALVKYDYPAAIRNAKDCVLFAPGPNEARRWANIVNELELKMTRGLERIWAALGMKKEVAE